MIIGVPRERKTLEMRVAVTPDGALELIRKGHTVIIETNAGSGSQFPDAQYIAVGCTIAQSLADVWTRADLVVKVKEPAPEEYALFRPGLQVFCFLHLASLPDVAKALLQSGVTSLAYELVQTADFRYPLLEPMSEIAGKLGIVNGSTFLLSQNGGRGILLGGAVGVPPAKVTVLGAGIAGRAAAEMALGMGAEVTVLDVDLRRLEGLKYALGRGLITLFSNAGTLERVLLSTDLLIGAVLIPGAKAPKIVTRAMVHAMKPGSVIVDISIDQGGCVETMKTTSLDKPTYVDGGVIHYGVPNMPAQTPLTSTLALTNRTLPFIEKIASKDGWRSDARLSAALNTIGGQLTNEAVGVALGLPYVSIASI